MHEIAVTTPDPSAQPSILPLLTDPFAGIAHLPTGAFLAAAALAWLLVIACNRFAGAFSRQPGPPGRAATPAVVLLGLLALVPVAVLSSRAVLATLVWIDDQHPRCRITRFGSDGRSAGTMFLDGPCLETGARTPTAPR